MHSWLSMLHPARIMVLYATLYFCSITALPRSRIVGEGFPWRSHQRPPRWTHYVPNLSS
jgi:hypothetical protein